MVVAQTQPQSRGKHLTNLDASNDTRFPKYNWPYLLRKFCQLNVMKILIPRTQASVYQICNIITVRKPIRPRQVYRVPSSSSRSRNFTVRYTFLRSLQISVKSSHGSTKHAEQGILGKPDAKVLSSLDVKSQN